jgi:hypothetical protein
LFTLSEDVVVDNVLIIPRGATVHGTAVQSKKAGTLTGSPDLILKLVSLDLGGRSHPLYSYQFKVEGTSKTKPTETKVKGGALVEDSPGDAGQLVDHGDYDDVFVRSGVECIEPRSNRCSVALDMQYRRSRAMNQDPAQVSPIRSRIAAVGYAGESLY